MISRRTTVNGPTRQDNDSARCVGPHRVVAIERFRGLIMSSPTPAPGHPDHTDRPATPSRAESAGWGNPMEVGLENHGSHRSSPRRRSPVQLAVLIAGLLCLLVGVAGFLPAVTVNDDILWFSDQHYGIHALLGVVGVALIVFSVKRGPHNRGITSSSDQDRAHAGDDDPQDRHDSPRVA